MAWQVIAGVAIAIAIATATESGNLISMLHQLTVSAVRAMY